MTPIAAEVDGLKSKLFEKDREIVAKKAAAESEARGVGDTGKAGRGPKFKELNDALKRAQEERAVLALQLKEFDGRLQLARDSVATAQAELAQIDGELGKLRGETEVADKQMSVQSGLAKSEAAPTADGSGGLDSLEIARAQFRQSPERASFDAVHKHCNDLLKTFERVGELKSEAEAKGVRCDPGIVAEQAAKVFAFDRRIGAPHGRVRQGREPAADRRRRPAARFRRQVRPGFRPHRRGHRRVPRQAQPRWHFHVTTRPIASSSAGTRSSTATSSPIWHWRSPSPSTRSFSCPACSAPTPCARR